MEETCYEKLINSYKENKDGCIVFNMHKMKTVQLIRDIESFSFALRDLGFNRGDTLTLYLPTCPQAVVAFYACSKMGVIANIVHPLLPFEQLLKNIVETNSKGIMYFDILIKNQQELEQVNQIMINCSVADYTFYRKGIFKLYARIKSVPSKRAWRYKSLLKQNYAKVGGKSRIKGKGSSVVTTMHSGGTSGVPKIVKLSNNALNALCDNLVTMYTQSQTFGKNEYALVALPIFHAYGLGVAIHTCLVKHYNLILLPKFSPKTMNKCMHHYNVTFIAGVPIIFRKMMEEKHFKGKHLRKLKDLWCGGDVVSEHFVEHFDEVLKTYNAPARLMRGYGLTEVSSVCAVNTKDHYRKSSCGKPMPNTTIEIWDPDGEDKYLPNQIGEIVVSTPSMMESYEDGTGVTVKNGIRYVRTGDIGYLDKDNYLYVIDRKKRSIKIAAVNVFPAEIEEVAKHNKNVCEACAVPYHYKEKTYIRLYVTVVNRSNIKESQLEEDLRKLISESLIKYAVPREVKILDEFPVTRIGKIDYKKLERM